MPSPALDWVWEVGVALVVGSLALRRQPAIAIGAGLFCAAATVSVLVPSALGGNVGRIEDILALPFATALLWERARLLLPVAAVPLALSQWGPAWGAFNAGSAAPSTRAAFFAPLDAELRTAGGPAGRVEVVPTEYHWEAAYVAPVMPLARGWERQVDIAYNPLFYRPGALTPGAYRAWLVSSGTRFVALADASLDMAGRAEATLISSGGVPGLRLIWSSANWRLYSVSGSPGIVSGPGRLVSTSGNDMVVDAHAPGAVLVRVRFTSALTIRSGAGCLVRSGPDSVLVRVPRSETFTLGVSLTNVGRRSC
jgi:hypothetical protein